MIDRITTDKIKEAAQIVDVVSDFVTLKKAGANYKGLCPFHDDRTPSFMVSPAKNYCKCFACGKGGNPIGFIMEHEQLTYPDALRYLAKKYGITIEERELTDEERAAQSEKDSMYILNEWAMKWFQDQMYDTADGRAIGLSYFRSRGFRDDIVRKFQLGFCPKGRDTMTRAAQKEGYQNQFLTGTGLSIQREDGSIFDRFSGRVMFPWHTIGGKVAGFGGRVLDAATKGVAVKYQNSPESTIYSKRRELYGLYQAKLAINKQDRVYMVEGYTDVISMHQCGIENVVANSGTALTHEQIVLLHRFTNNITLLYDGDDAGIHAAQRGTDMFLAAGMNVKILLLPDGDDPDSFARKHNAQEFKDYVEANQVDFIQFKTNLLLEKAQGDPHLLSNLVNEIVASISVIPDEISRSIYIRQAAQTMQMDEQMILRAVAKQIVENRNAEHKARNTQVQDKTNIHPQPEQQETVIQESSSVQTPKQETDNPFLTHELLLAQIVVRHGDVKICEMTDEDGNTRAISVAEFIAGSLLQDELIIKNPMARFIIDEAVNQSQNPDFVAEKHFLNHDDQNVAKAAFSLSMDKEELSKYHTRNQSLEETPDSLMKDTRYLLANLRLAIIRQRIKGIMAEMSNPVIRTDRTRGYELLKELKEAKEIESTLAKECGDRVLS